MNDEYIYLDYAANTPVDKQVLDVFNGTTLKYYANPNSTHKLGRIVKKEIEDITCSIIDKLKKIQILMMTPPLYILQVQLNQIILP